MFHRKSVRNRTLSEPRMLQDLNTCDATESAAKHHPAE
jgi:hypothetical protein